MQQLAVDLMTRHAERFSPLKPQSVRNAQADRTGRTARQVCVASKAELVNRLGHALKQYYPQVLEWFNHHNTVVFCDFLKPVADARARQSVPAKQSLNASLRATTSHSCTTH